MEEQEFVQDDHRDDDFDELPDLATASTQDLELVPGGLYHALLRAEAKKRAEERLVTPPNQSLGTPEPASPPSGQHHDQHHDTPLGRPRTCLRGSSSWRRAQAQGRNITDEPEFVYSLGESPKSPAWLESDDSSPCQSPAWAEDDDGNDECCDTMPLAPAASFNIKTPAVVVQVDQDDEGVAIRSEAESESELSSSASSLTSRRSQSADSRCSGCVDDSGDKSADRSVSSRPSRSVSRSTISLSSDTEDEAATVVLQQCKEFLKWCNLQRYPFHLLELLEFGMLVELWERRHGFPLPDSHRRVLKRMAAKLVKQLLPRDSNSEEEQPDPESMERCSDGAKGGRVTMGQWRARKISNKRSFT